MTKRMILMLVAVGIIFGGIFGYKAFVSQMISGHFENMPEQAATITAAEVKTDRWTPKATAVGTFAAVNGAQLTTEAQGIVTGIHFENGSEVTKGQRLVSLDTQTDEAELESLKAAEKLAELELQRNRKLYRENNVSESELQRSESQAAQTRAAVNAQQARIAQKTIRAPFDGLAGIRQVNLGQYVAPGNPVVGVQALDPIYLNFTLAERRFADIQEGQTVTAQVDAYPDVQFSGQITAIEPSVRESTRTFEVQATLSNSDLKLRPGMFGRVVVDTGAERQVLIAPQTAIQFNPYGNSVFVIREQEGDLRVTQRFIRTGERRGDLVEILDGLEEGDRIASSGLLKLRNEALVKISEDEANEPTTELNPQPENQ